jgi:UrcA family protein
MTGQANHLTSSLLALVCAAGLTTAAAPALAGEPVSGLTIVASDASHISASVEYRDLDLTTGSGRKELQRRVWRTAVALCDRIDDHSSYCASDAVMSASAAERDVISHAVPRTYAAVMPGPQGPGR